ncbi:MAG: phage head-tail connector protein [Brevundimonas sp.]|nr:phage head-tail connector protein [Brevundimonas sp.]
MIADLDEAKMHIGIEHAHQDVFLQSLLDRASDACLSFIGSSEPTPVPLVLKTAVLQTFAAFFEGREGAGIPDDAALMLHDLRPWVF